MEIVNYDRGRIHLNPDLKDNDVYEFDLSKYWEIGDVKEIRAYIGDMIPAVISKEAQFIHKKSQNKLRIIASGQVELFVIDFTWSKRGLREMKLEGLL